MAPELWENKPATTAVDVYSLACVFFEMITGEALFTGISPLEIMRRQALAEPQFPNEWAEGVPAKSDIILRKALEKSPQDRYTMARDFVTNLEKLYKQGGLTGIVGHKKSESDVLIRQELPERQINNTQDTTQTKTSEPKRFDHSGKKRIEAKKQFWLKPHFWLWFLAIIMIGIVIGIWFFGSKTDLLSASSSDISGVSISELTSNKTSIYPTYNDGVVTAQPQSAINPETAIDVVELARWGKGSIIQVVWSPDSDTIALATSLGLYLYKSEPLLESIFTEIPSVCVSIAFSKDGNYLACGLEDGTIQLWQISEGFLTGILEGHTSAISSLAFSLDGAILASGSYDETIRFWQWRSALDRNTGDELLLRILVGHFSAIYSIAFSPDGSTLASSSFKEVRLWQVDDGALITVLEGLQSIVWDIAFSPDGSTLASGSYDAVRLWRVKDGALLYSWGNDDCIVYSVAFSPDGSVLAYGLWSPLGNHDIQLVRTSDGTTISTLEGHSSEVTSLAFSLDGTILMSGSRDSARLWQVSNGALLASLEGYSPGVNSYALSPRGDILASGSSDAIIRLWRVNDGLLLDSLEGHTSYIDSVAFSADGSILASGSYDNSVRLWQVSDGDLLSILNEPGRFDIGGVSIAISPDGDILAYRGLSGPAKLWRVSDGELISWTEEEQHLTLYDLAFSPDGSIIASGVFGNKDGDSVRMWRVEDQALINTLVGHTSRVFRVGFSPDGRTLASGSDDNTIILWRVSDGVILDTLEGHTSSIESLNFSPSGKILVSISGDEIRLWQVSDGSTLKTIKVNAKYVAFSPDGNTLVTGSGDGTIRIWGISPKQ